jgi:hypothetical protein
MAAARMAQAPPDRSTSSASRAQSSTAFTVSAEAHEYFPQEDCF